jgi:hypothetical protein
LHQLRLMRLFSSPTRPTLLQRPPVYLWQCA